MIIVCDLDWQCAASDLKGYFNINFFGGDRQNSLKNQNKIGIIFTMNRNRNFRMPLKDWCWNYQIWTVSYLSRLMGKPTICIGENKDADQLRGNREADQRLCFRYSDSTIPPLLNSKLSSF